MTKDSIAKSIVITGASSGIGREIALEMASDGHSFVLLGRNKERLESVQREVEALGGKAVVDIGEVSEEATVDRIYSKIQQDIGSVDVLVANAGVGHFGDLEDLSIQQYDDQFNTNVRGVFLWLRKVLPEMKSKNSGQIIVTSSNLGLKTSARASIYAATKHAVQAMVWSLRDELKGTLVKAATINPGSVDTPWFDGKDIDRSTMLSARDVAKAARLIIDQAETSNIDLVHLMPGKR
ncbi:MAG: SDR family NAD(P)-dependent oxidoreductase [Candidatus Thorarchaeota archaeon]|jgi:NADP-dependent 3-hydroxy acid dehydrogenase YdfG